MGKSEAYELVSLDNCAVVSHFAPYKLMGTQSGLSPINRETIINFKGLTYVNAELLVYL